MLNVLSVMTTGEESVPSVVTIEEQNELLKCQNEEQKRVIEMLRQELTKKDEKFVQLEEINDVIKANAELSTKQFHALQTETDQKIGEVIK